MPDPAPPAAAKAKQAPGRRRPGPSAAKSANRNKNYASENDAAGVDPSFRPDFARGGQKSGGGAPATPRKRPQKNNATAAAADATTATQGKNPAAPNQQSTSGKPNRRNKNGPKNAATPNAASKQQDGRRTPPAKGTAPISMPAGPDGGHDPQTSASAPSAAASTQVFAGNSFHASPAPSALPRPSFMQKSAVAALASPESPRARPTSGLSAVQQLSPPASDSELPSSTATTGSRPTPPTNRNPLFQLGVGARPDASPLDVLFQADRAEKAKFNRRASAANIYNGVPQQPFTSPRADAATDYGSSHTFPRDVSQQQHQANVRRAAPNLRTSSSGISAAELDGTPGQPIGPSFATPFQERMRAVKPTDLRGPPHSSAGGPGGPGGLAGGFSGFRNAGPGPQAAPPSGPPGNYMLTPPLSMQSPGGQSKNAGSDLEASLKRMLFSSPTASPSSAAPAMTTPSRHPAPPAFQGHPGAGPFTGAYRHGDGMMAHNGSPSHNAHGPPPAQGRPFGQIDPRFQGSAHTYNGPSHGEDHISRNAAMESSLRHILKMGSSNN